MNRIPILSSPPNWIICPISKEHYGVESKLPADNSNKSHRTVSGKISKSKSTRVGYYDQIGFIQPLVGAK